MPAILNINTDAVVKHTNTLEKLHKSALPVAIRGSLNSAAFDVKISTMPLSAKRAFIQRNKTFFKANSRVEQAKGFDVKTMMAVVGFIDNNLKGGNNFAVKDLEQQEQGGKIKRKSFIPTDVGRGGSSAKLVRPMNRLSKINNIIDSTKASGNSRKQRFIRAAIRAGKGGHVIGNFPNQKLYRITGIRKSSSGIKILSKGIYFFKKGRSIGVDPTNFMKLASLQSGKKIEQFFIKKAKAQIERLR